MSNIRFFKTFIAVAEYGSFAAAADRVALTNAAVGQQMRALEEEMRRPLFDRSQRQIKLSRDGVLLLPKAKRLLADYEQMIAEAPDGMAMEGEVSIGGITSGMGLLANCLVQLKKLHPRISVNLMTARSDEVVNLVHAAKLDASGKTLQQAPDQHDDRRRNADAGIGRTDRDGDGASRHDREGDDQSLAAPDLIDVSAEHDGADGGA